MKLNSGLIVVMAVFSAAVSNGDVRVQFHPEATPQASSFSVVTPRIGKVSWDGNSSSGYIIEGTPSLLPQSWNTFSTDVAAGNPTRHSIVMGNRGFFKVLSAPSFAVGQTVNWRASLTNLPTGSTEQQCMAQWNFSDGSSNSVTGSAWSSPIPKVYDFMGLKTARIVVSHPSGWRVTNQWAVAITNSPINLVTNGDFEQQAGLLPVGWQKGGFGSNSRTHIYPVSGFNGSAKAAQVVISNYVSGDAKWYFNNIPVQAGGRYHWDSWYQSTVSPNFTIQYTYTNGVVSYELMAIPAWAPGWQRMERDIYPPPGVNSLTVFPALTTNGSLTIDLVSLVRIPMQPPLSEGMISFDGDDGHYDTTLTMASILETAGYRATFYIVTPRVGLPGVVTRNNLLSLQNAGHEIGAHSLNHDDLTHADLATAETEINISRSDLLSWGLQPVSAFAYPFGAYNSTVQKLAREAGFNSASSTDGGFNQRGVNPYVLKRTSIRSSMTLAQVKGMIDSALAQKQWFIPVFHHVDSTTTEYSVSPAFFQQVVDYVKSKNAKVVTVSEGVRILNQ